MSNIFEKIGVGLSDVGKWVGDAVKAVLGIAGKVKTILEAEQKLEPAFIAGLSTVVKDVENLIALSETAVTDGAVNFPADSAAYNQFITLMNDFKALVPVVEAGIAALKDNKCQFIKIQKYKFVVD
jgi:hypothetical protein